MIGEETLIAAVLKAELAPESQTFQFSPHAHDCHVVAMKMHNVFRDEVKSAERSCLDRSLWTVFSSE